MGSEWAEKKNQRVNKTCHIHSACGWDECPFMKRWKRWLSHVNRFQRKVNGHVIRPVFSELDCIYLGTALFPVSQCKHYLHNVCVCVCGEGDFEGFTAMIIVGSKRGSALNWPKRLIAIPQRMVIHRIDRSILLKFVYDISITMITVTKSAQ